MTADNSHLFRHEAMRNRSEEDFGTVSASVRPLQKFIVSAILILALCIILLLILGKYTKRVNVRAVITPEAGIIRIKSNTSGITESVHATQGTRVEIDSNLIDIVNEIVSDDSGIRTKHIASLNESLTRLSKEETLQHTLYLQDRAILESQISSLTKKQDNLRDFQAALNHEISSLEELMSNLEELLKRRFITESYIRSFRQDLFEKKAQLKQNNENIIDTEDKKQASVLRLSKIKSSLDLELSQKSRERLGIQRELSDLQGAVHSSLRSPVNGTVSNILTTSGKSVANGETLITIIPDDGEFNLRLIIEPQFGGFIHSDQIVAFKADAFPFQKYGVLYAVVKNISINTLTPEEILEETGTVQATPAYLATATIQLNNQKSGKTRFNIKSGMTGDAVVMLDTRTLLEWIIDPALRLNENLSIENSNE